MYSCIICQSECSGKRRKYCSDECLKEGKNIHSKVYGKKWREKKLKRATRNTTNLKMVSTKSIRSPAQMDSST